MSNPKANVSTTKLQVAPIESVGDVQGSKGVVPKSKLKLKPLKETGQQRGEEIASTEGNMALNSL